MRKTRTIEQTEKRKEKYRNSEIGQKNKTRMDTAIEAQQKERAFNLARMQAKK